VGAIVPASTFMYGSILIEETCLEYQPWLFASHSRILILSPIVFNSRPVEEAIRNQPSISPSVYFQVVGRLEDAYQ